MLNVQSSGLDAVTPGGCERFKQVRRGSTKLSETVFTLVPKQRFERREQNFFFFCRNACKPTPKNGAGIFRGAAVFTCFASRQISWNAAFSLGFVFCGAALKSQQTKIKEREKREMMQNYCVSSPTLETHCWTISLSDIVHHFHAIDHHCSRLWSLLRCRASHTEFNFFIL